MAGKRKAPLWRQAFLRALKRTGNVRASAFEAGVDPGTAYDHRAKDAGFAAKWGEALAAFKAMEAKAGKGAPRLRSGRTAGGEELVLRRTKHGDKMVRAAPGRWSARIEESFLDALEHAGCVESAAASAGLSANAFYHRRDRYPEFRARWEERLARNRERLPGLLDAAAVQSLSPAGAKRRGRTRLPQLDVDQLIRVKVANDNAAARGQRDGRRGGILLRKPEESPEELVEKAVRLVGMLKKRREKERAAAGWTRLACGIWLPPGWTAVPPPGWTPEPGGERPG